MCDNAEVVEFTYYWQHYCRWLAPCICVYVGKEAGVCPFAHLVYLRTRRHSLHPTFLDQMLGLVLSVSVLERMMPLGGGQMALLLFQFFRGRICGLQGNQIIIEAENIVSSSVNAEKQVLSV